MDKFKKMKYSSWKCSEADFDAMSVFEKRAYILQDIQEETMWWSRTANKIMVLSVIIGFMLALYALGSKQ